VEVNSYEAPCDKIPVNCVVSVCIENETGFCQCLFFNTSQKAQLRAPLSPLQTAWIGFVPYLYSGGSFSAGPALVEIATARSFILERGIVTDVLA